MKNPLFGRWKSNEELTRREIVKCNKYADTDIDELFSLVKYGELEFIFTNNELTTKYKDDVSTTSYKILSLSASEVSILTSDLGELHYEITNDMMYVANGLKHFKEVFTKIG